MKRATFLLSALLVVMLACNFGTGLAPGDIETNDASDTNAVGDGFSAEAAEGSVTLKWDAMDGAENYLIEILLFDEYFALGVLPADQLSYEDEVPGETDYTYRLTSLDQDGERGETRDVTVFVPEKKSSPASVTYTLDMGAPLIDPENFDPANIDPSMLDPNNLDPSMLLPQDLFAEALIGLEGGELSVTGSTGVTYILTVPPGALLFDELIRISPISEISGLPLSGGMLGAVLIEPQDVYFTTPARLEFITPEGYASPQGLLQMGFAFDESGQEFHLYPFLEDLEARLGGGHLAKMSLAPWMDGSAPGMGVQDGGGYGQGSGTTQDVQNVNPPTNQQDRSAQEAAKAQLDDDLSPLSKSEENLAPLQSESQSRVRTNKALDSIRSRISKAETISDVVNAMDALKQQQYANGKFINSKTLDKLIQQLSDKLAEFLLNGKFENCLSKDSMEAQEAIRRLKDPNGSVEKAIAENVKKKLSQVPVVFPDGVFGDKWEEIVDRVKQCTIELQMDSEITGNLDGTIIITTAKVETVSLKVTLQKGKPVFAGSMETEKIEVKGSGKQCKNVNFPLDPLTLRFKLKPVYDKDGNVKDFGLDITAQGGTTAVKGKNNFNDCPIVNLFSSAGKGAWYTMYVSNRSEQFDDIGITGWEIKKDDSGIKSASKKIDLKGIPGPAKSSIDEKADFQMVITLSQ